MQPPGEKDQSFLPLILPMQQTPVRLVGNYPTNDRYALLPCYFLLQSMACSSFSPHPGCKAPVFTWSSDPSPILNLTAPFPLSSSDLVWPHICNYQAATTVSCVGGLLLHRGSGCGCFIPGTAGETQPPPATGGGGLHAVTRHMISQSDTRHPYSKK